MTTRSLPSSPLGFIRLAGAAALGSLAAAVAAPALWLARMAFGPLNASGTAAEWLKVALFAVSVIAAIATCVVLPTSLILGVPLLALADHMRWPLRYAAPLLGALAGGLVLMLPTVFAEKEAFALGPTLFGALVGAACGLTTARLLKSQERPGSSNEA